MSDINITIIDEAPAISLEIGLDKGPKGDNGDGGSGVDSVNGRTGPVVLTKADVGLSNVQNINQADLTLSGLKDVTLSNPALGQRLEFNGDKWVNGQGATVSAGAGVNLYPTLTPSDLWSPYGYFYFEKAPDLLPELDIPITVNNNKIVFVAYVNDPAINVTTLNAGVWTLYIWSYASDLNCYVIADFYKRTSGGTETLLFSMSTPQLSTILTQYLVSSIQPQFTLDPTDRLVVKSSGYTTNLTDTIVHGVGGGNTHFTYINTPLVVNHDDLNGLQGGSANQYFHLTSAQLTNLNNQSGSNTGDETQNSIITKIGYTPADQGFAIAMAVALS